jgi:hypothetical protein
MRKGCAWVGLSVVATAFTVGFVSVERAIAQASPGKPSAEQLRDLERQLRKIEKDRNFSIYYEGGKLNSIREYRKAWAKIYPKTASMFGYWGDGYEFGYTIYPTKRADQVCLLTPANGDIRIGTVRGNTITYDQFSRTSGSIYADRNSSVSGTVTIYNLGREQVIGAEIPETGSQRLMPFVGGMPMEAGSEGEKRFEDAGCLVTPPAINVASQAQAEKSTSKEYQISNLSFKAPSHWIDYSDGINGITLFNQKRLTPGGGSTPENMIRLNAGILSQGIEASIAPHPGGMEMTILKTENFIINGKKAVRQYIQYADDGSFSNAVSTYVELDTKKTAYVTVMYTRTNPYAEKSIEQINRSLSIVQPTKVDAVSTPKPAAPGQPKLPPSKAKPLPPVIAKPTYPSPANLANLAKQKPSGKPPSKTEEKERDDLRKQWKPKNPLVTPFIGGWRDPNGEEIFIYPSDQEKRICSVRAIGDKYDIQHNIVMGNAEGKDVLIGKTKQLFSLGKPNVLAIRDSKTSSLRQLVAIPGSPDLDAGDVGELERRGCIAALPGGTAGTIAKQPDKPYEISAASLRMGLQNRKHLLASTEDKPAMLDRIVIERYQEVFDANKKIKRVSLLLYNTSFSPVAIEVTDSYGKQKSIEYVDGRKPGFKDMGDVLQTTASGLLQPFRCASRGRERCWAEFKHDTYGVERKEITLQIEPGGSIFISRSSDAALAYTVVNTIIDTAELSVSAVDILKAGKKSSALPMANMKYSPSLRKEIVKGFLREEIGGKYTWKMLREEFIKDACRKSCANPTQLLEISHDILKNIPNTFWEKTTDGSVAYRAAGDGLDALLVSVGGASSSIVNSSLFLSQSANIASRIEASRLAAQKPLPIFITGFDKK